MIPDQIRERIASTWPDADAGDCIFISPLGSRRDVLIYWRVGGRVTTGRRGEGPCFEGSLDDFEEKLEQDYGMRLEVTYGDKAATTKRLSEYRAAVAFLRALPI